MTTTAFNGDCLKIMKDLSDASIDCFICDLPYGCLTNQAGESKGFIRENQNEEVKKKLAKQSGEGCAWDIKINLTEFWKQVKRLSKNKHTPVLMFCTTKFGYELIKSNESWFRYDLVWDKQRGVSFLQANRMPMRSHEMIYVFSQQGAAYQRVDISGGTPYLAHKKEYPSSSNYITSASDFIKNNGQLEGKRCALSVIPVNEIEEEADHEMIYVFADKGAAYQRVDISGNFTAFKSTDSKEHEYHIYTAERPNFRRHTKDNDGTKRCALSVIPINEIEEEQEQEQDHEMIYVFADKGAAYQRVDISGNFTAFKAFNREYQFDKNLHGGNNTNHIAIGNDGPKRCALSVIPINEIEEEQEQEQEQDHEMIYVFADKGAAYQRVDIDDPDKKARFDNLTTLRTRNVYSLANSGLTRSHGAGEGKRCAVSVVKVKSAPGKGKHPTEKPKDLYKWLIERYSKPGDTILDPTAGSFNSCIVANELGRNAIGIEMDKGFFDKACVKMGLE